MVPFPYIPSQGMWATAGSTYATFSGFLEPVYMQEIWSTMKKVVQSLKLQET
jgi:hypothetical protein